MKKLCAKFVPKNLTIEQKDNRTHLCLHLLERIQSYRNFLKNVITGDETWIFEYDPEKKQSKEWHTSAPPRPKKAIMSKSKIKSILICFLTIHTESVPQGQTVNQFITVRFLKDQEKELFACDQTLRTIGCSITTMPLVTWWSLWSNFWIKMAFLWIHSPMLPWSESMRPFLYPKLKFHLKGRHFRDGGKHRKSCNRPTKSDSG